MIVDKIINKINSSKKHKLFYLSPFVYTVGNCAEDILWGIVKAKQENKKLFLLYPFDIPLLFQYKLTNKYLFSLKSDYIYHQGKLTLLFSRSLITLIYLPLRLISLFLRTFLNIKLYDSYNFPLIGIEGIYSPGKKYKAFSVEAGKQYEWDRKLDKIKDVRLEIDCHESSLNNLGLPENAWFVCLHVRECGFRNDKGRREYRNSNILNYVLAIKEITSRGGWVVRMGDSTMTRLPELEQVIDYPFTSLKSEYMDLLLIQNCRFYIGTQSGIFDVAKLFHKDVLITNMYSWTLGWPFFKNDRGIIKHLFSRVEGRYLSVKELLTGGWELQNVNRYLSEDYVWVENTEEEILLAVIEFMDMLSSNDKSLSVLQKQANEFHKKQGCHIISNDEISPSHGLSNDEIIWLRHKYLADVYCSQGSLCNSFLDKNWSNDSMNVS